MKIRGLMILLSVLFFGALAKAQNIFVVGLRANQAEVIAYSEAHQIPVLPRSAEEFANGNTFVRLQQDVTSATVTVVLPKEMNSNSLMEALMTIFSLRKNGAHEVRVALPSATPTITLTDLGKKVSIGAWLQTAGAQTIVLNGEERSLPRARSAGASRVRPNEVVVVGLHHDQLAEEISNRRRLQNLQTINPETVGQKGVLLVAPSPEPVNLSFFKMLISAKQTQASGAAFVELVTPYLPYARSDKVDQAGVAVYGKLIANLIEAAGVNAVSFVRAHAPQSEGFFNIPTRNISGRQTINAFLEAERVEAVISPDAGFQKDATLYADELKVPVAVVNKQRDPITSKTVIVGMSGPDVRGKRVVIIDDETASGSTLSKTAEHLRKMGATHVIAVVTHLTGDAAAALDSPALDKVAVTDTLPIMSKHPKLVVLSIAGELAENVFSAKLRAPSLSCKKVHR